MSAFQDAFNKAQEQMDDNAQDDSFSDEQNAGMNEDDQSSSKISFNSASENEGYKKTEEK